MTLTTEAPASQRLARLSDYALRADGASVPLLLQDCKAGVQILTLRVEAGTWTLRVYWREREPDFVMLYAELHIPGDAVTERLAHGCVIRWGNDERG